MRVDAARRIGPYELVCRIGHGGMAEVFLASHEPMAGSPRLVAIKRILSSLAAKSSFLEMFLDEARVLSRLYHPNLDRVLDAGEDEGVPYIVLDYLPGRDLGLVLRAHERRELLSPEISVHIAARVASGLAHAHGLTDASGRCLGIVHRDVSPENIIITFEGTVKVVDFGVARGAMRVQETAPGLIKGKPSFMAPEQILARPVDRRADVFALGVLLYRLTVGRHPFGVDSDDAATFHRLIDDAAPPPHLVSPAYPRTLSAVLMKALEKEPGHRHSSAEDLVADLEGVMREQGWFPSERKLARLMAELFPHAAAAARRVTVQPADSDAARQASYLTRGDLRLDIEVGGEEEDTEMATEPGPPSTVARGGSAVADMDTDKGGFGAPAPRTRSHPTLAATADMDSATSPAGPADMDSVTKPERLVGSLPRPAGRSMEARARAPRERVDRSASTSSAYEAAERGRDARLTSSPPDGAGAPHPARDLPPPPIDSRLLGDPEDSLEAYASAMSTHPGRSAAEREGEKALPAEESSVTAIGMPRPSGAWGRSGDSAQRSAGRGAQARPPWRTPAGIIVTAVIGGATLLAIALSLCGG